jgi:fluoride exporter
VPGPPRGVRRRLAVALGGVAGACARWAVLAVAPTAPRFPWPVLVVNVVGCALVGWIVARADDGATHPVRADLLRDAGAIGFCGGFTTFSTFALQVARLVDDGRAATAAAYATASILLGVAAVLAGAAAARRGHAGPPLQAPS